MAARSGQGYARRSRAQWQWLIAEQAGSGLSQRAFCERRGLAYATFCGWRRRLREELAARARESDGPAFVELDVAGAASGSGWEVELALGEGVVLRLRRR